MIASFAKAPKRRKGRLADRPGLHRSYEDVMPQIQEPSLPRTPERLRSSNHLLSALATNDYVMLRKAMQPVAYPSGHVLYEPEAPVQYIYFPEEGLVSMISIMRSGHEVESAVVGREGAVGFIEAVGAGTMFSRAVVQIGLKAMRVPVKAYVAAFDSSRVFRRTIAAHVELNIAEGRQTIACISHHHLPQRLAWWILECQDRTGLDQLPLTQDFLSAMLGVKRSSVSPVAMDLKIRGLIDYKRGLINVVDREGLERVSCECYATNAHFREVIEAALEGAG